MRVANAPLLAATAVALSQSTSAIKLDHLAVADVMAIITAANPSNKAFASADVSAAANSIAIAAHGLLTGTKATLTTDDTLPGGLAVLTDYYVINFTTGSIKLATSQANALAGTPIDITNAGTGNHVVVITTTIAGTVTLQKNDEPADETAVWKDIAAGTAFTGTITLNWPLVDIGYRELRAVVAVTSGTVTAAVRVNAKGV